MDGELLNWYMPLVHLTQKVLVQENGSIVELVSDTVIVNWTIGGTWPYKEQFCFQEIGIELVTLSCEAVACK